MNARSHGLLVVLALLAAGPAAVPVGAERAALRPTFFAGGTQVHELDHRRWTTALREAGLNSVAVTSYAKQRAWNRAHLWWEADEPAVIDEIRAAKAEGLAAVLVLTGKTDRRWFRLRLTGSPHPRCPISAFMSTWQEPPPDAHPDSPTPGGRR